MISAESPRLLPNAPIHEMSFTVSTIQPIVDPMRISDVRDALSTEYPQIERQVPVGSLEAGAVIGSPPMILDADQGVPPRWWFISPDGSMLAQAQERMVAWNWRRLDRDSPSNYPGFEECVSRAHSAFEAIGNAGHHSSQPDEVEISGAQLTYDNIIPMVDREGQARSLEDILTNWNTLQPRRLTAAFQIGWVEPVNPDATSLSSILSVNIALGALIPNQGSEPLPIAKVVLSTATNSAKWSTIWDYFSTSHDLVIKRFSNLIRPKILEDFSR